jgi:acetolactate synthase I/II/III large subunit
VSAHDGATRICEALSRAGVECVFGLPGTQNVPLFEALRTSPLRTIVATNELSASMMANGYYRASGRIPALVTIPGPGFTWALTGVAEAALDSAAMVYLVNMPATAPGRSFQLQAIDQDAMLRPIVRAVHRVERPEDVSNAIAAACRTATREEPGPVAVHVSRAALHGAAEVESDPVAPVPAAMDAAALEEAIRSIAAARRCVILAGQGCQDAAADLVGLAEALGAAVVTTTSGRGVVPEDHPLSLGFELAGNGVDTLNALVDASDLVVAIGVKFSHNGSRGFRLRLPPDKLVHVDASSAVLGANYPARVMLRADASAFIAAARTRLPAHPAAGSGFGDEEIASYRTRGYAEGLTEFVEPRIHGVASGKAADFFAALRNAMPRVSTLVTDSGFHQVLARLHFRVLCPRGLITPTNLQSMGFGIGAAIGASIADPTRPVVALIGDGGLAMSGLEILTAVRERLRLVVIVFVDAAYGLIRIHQLSSTGRTFATEFAPADAQALAAAVGARYLRVENDAEATLREALASDGVSIVEVGVGDTLPMQWLRAKAVAKTFAGPRARSWVKRLLGRS